MKEATADDATRKAPEARIAEMVASGNLTPDQAQELLGALNETPKPSPFMVLLDPCERLTPAATVVAFVAMFLAHFGLTRGGYTFRGAFDMHFMPPAMSVAAALAQLAVVMCGTTLVFWIAMRLAGSTARLIDVAGVTAAYRFPMLLLGLITLPMKTILEEADLDSAPHIILAVFGIGTIAWLLVLLFRGVRWASALSGGRLWAVYIGGIIIAEGLLVAVTRLLLV